MPRSIGIWCYYKSSRTLAELKGKFGVMQRWLEREACKQGLRVGQGRLVIIARANSFPWDTRGAIGIKARVLDEEAKDAA